MSACSDEVSSHYARCPSPVSLIEYPFRILDLVPTQNSGRNPIYLTSSYCARTTIQDSCIVTDETQWEVRRLVRSGLIRMCRID